VPFRTSAIRRVSIGANSQSDRFNQYRDYYSRCLPLGRATNQNSADFVIFPSFSPFIRRLLLFACSNGRTKRTFARSSASSPAESK
jgi:hypothetical protein